MRSLLVAVLLTLFGDVYQALIPNYVAEVYFVVDKKVVDNYMRERTEASSYEKNQKAIASIKADVNYFVSELNHLFKSMSSFGLNVEIRSRQLDILSSDLYTGSQTNVKHGLETFDNWLRSQSAYSKLGYDLAVLWTGHDLVGAGIGDDGTAGYAHLAGVCRREGASAIVEFDGTYHTVVVTAHEIGHVLGADHDYDNRGYIMAPASSAGSSNRWKFTSNSATTILRRLDQSNCLLETNPASVALSGTVTTALKDPDVICQRSVRSPNSYMCKSPSMYGNSVPKGDSVCRDIYCQVTNPNRGNTCQTAFSTDGLTCGANKVCREGTCQIDASSGTGNIDADCIWGDIKVFKITVNAASFEGTCSEFTDRYGKTFCSQAAVSRSCCKTCGNLRDSVAPANCQYGDQKILSVTINDVPFSGTCPRFITQYGQSMCDFPSIQDACCTTCGNRKSRSRSRSTIRFSGIGSFMSRLQSRSSVRLSDIFGSFLRGKRSTGDEVKVIRDIVEEVRYSK